MAVYNTINIDATYDIVLETKELTKYYGSGSNLVIAVDNVNLKVRRGEFTSIVGPSGSGKSTMLNLIGALARPTKGKVFIDGIDIFRLDDKRLSIIRNKKIGFIFQAYNLINRITVFRNVELPAIIANVPAKVRHKKVIELLELLGIKDKADAKPTELSGGQQQRVAIARALINDPAIILADEPTGNLDTKTGDEVFKLLKRLVKEQKRTIIMVTHNPELAEATDRSIIFRDGKVEKEVVHS
ncbi:MAG: putative ABC transporter ATP-binding protein [Candidatus Nitrosocaldaceae archaeon]|nr:MAG: putative ABC transporter ATP-binding protein [Candidatus Nitrosocaldaceae archaeon]